MRLARRPLAALALMVTLAGTVACGASDSSGGQSGDDRVEVFSWWSGVGEEEALNALVDHFGKKNPSIEFVNAAVVGGSGLNAQAMLDARLAAKDPPDSYQVHVGAELGSDVRAGRLHDLEDLFDDLSLRDKFPQQLLEAISVDNRVYSVPLNVHRTNLIWYNPKVLAKVGISGPPKDWTDFRVQAEKLRIAGFTPLALGPTWTHRQLLEAVLLGELGPELYKGLWNGKTDWRTPQVAGALLTAVLVFEYSDIRSPASDWQSALGKALSPTGGVAYTVMGDWAYPFALRQGLKYQSDFAMAPSPGTQGVFGYMADSFAMPKSVPHPGAVRRWLEECASTEGQDVFNPVRGSLPARIDSDPTQYTGYQAESLTAWRDPATTIVGSMAHGAVVNRLFTSAIDVALAKLVEDHDKENFVDAIVKGYEESR